MFARQLNIVSVLNDFDINNIHCRIKCLELDRIKKDLGQNNGPIQNNDDYNNVNHNEESINDNFYHNNKINLFSMNIVDILKIMMTK